MAEAGSSYSSEDEQWRTQQAEKDQTQRKFYRELDKFPNLFSLRSELRDQERINDLLQKQEKELEDGMLQYQLETLRCHNLIIFCHYILGKKQSALNYSEALKLKIDTSKSIIFLTLKAMLQWEFGHKQECSATMDALRDLYKIPEYQYLLAVAESEKGYLLICMGPRGFLKAIDTFQRAIDTCPNSDIYLWKYDLALAIRRNFNVHVYSDHEQGPADLAERAVTLLSDISRNCPNEHYKAKALLELARLVDHLKTFCGVCDERHQEKIMKLLKTYDENALFEEALRTKAGKEDFYILRECGRHYLATKDYREAVRCFEVSCCKRETDIVYQLFGKAYLAMYRNKVHFFSPQIKSDLDNKEIQAHAGNSALLHPAPGDSNLSAECGHFEFMSKEEQQLVEEFERSTFLNEDGTFKTTEHDSIGNLPVPQHQRPEPKIPVQVTDSEEDAALKAKLLREFDDHIFIDEAGKYKTTQPCGVVGNLCVSQPHRNDDKPAYKTSQSFPPVSVETNLERRGRVSSQRRTSFPPSVDPSHQRRSSPYRPFPRSGEPPHELGCSARKNPFPASGDARFQGNGSSPQRNIFKQPVNHKSLLKSYKGKLAYYDASDLRIKTAEYFFLKGLKLNAVNISLVYDTGVLYEAMENLKKAVEFYQKIISIPRLSNRISLVNAFERTGLCLIEMAEKCEHKSEQLELKTRAEDMFMSSLLKCQEAVAHLPQVNARRAVLWESYPQLLKILHQSERSTANLQKEAQVHEMVGEHLKAISVYQEVMKVAQKTEDRIQALLGTVNNYFREQVYTMEDARSQNLLPLPYTQSVCPPGVYLEDCKMCPDLNDFLQMGSTREARFALELFLTVEEERSLILTATDDATQSLRRVAVRIFSQSGTEALQSRDIAIARSAFNTALLLKGRLVDKVTKEPPTLQCKAADPSYQQGSQNAGPDMLEFDLSIFYDEEGPEQLSELATCVADTSKKNFGMRVSINNEEGPLGRLDFESELHLVESTPLVMLIVNAGADLHPRMRYIATMALQIPSLHGPADRVMLVTTGDPTQMPSILRGLHPFCEIDTLLALKDSNDNETSVCCLFNFLLGYHGHENEHRETEQQE